MLCKLVSRKLVVNGGLAEEQDFQHSSSLSPLQQSNVCVHSVWRDVMCLGHARSGTTALAGPMWIQEAMVQSSLREQLECSTNLCQASNTFRHSQPPCSQLCVCDGMGGGLLQEVPMGLFMA